MWFSLVGFLVMVSQICGCGAGLGAGLGAGVSSGTWRAAGVGIGKLSIGFF